MFAIYRYTDLRVLENVGALLAKPVPSELRFRTAGFASKAPTTKDLQLSHAKQERT